MATKKTADTSPSLDPARALQAFRQQVTRLEALKQRQVDDVESEESEWEHFTQSLIEGTFGKDSSNMSKFYSARNAGYHNIAGLSPQQHQQNYNERIREYEALLKSLIRELQLRLPEDDIQGVYAPGDEYGFYRDLSTLFAASPGDIFLIDAYLRARQEITYSPENLLLVAQIRFSIVQL